MTAIASGVILGGCGGSGNTARTYSVYASTVVTTTDIPEERFVPRINKTCRRGWVRALENFAEYRAGLARDPSESERLGAVRIVLLTEIDIQIFDEIQRTGAPRGEEDELEEIIGPLQSAVERGQKRLAPISSVPQLLELFAEYNQRARRYGLDDCLVDETHLRGIE
jgi:hypothetical protein